MTKQNRNYRSLGETTEFGKKRSKPIQQGDTSLVPMFLLVSGPQKGRPLPFPEGRWTIGRGSESDFSVHGRGISRTHLKLKSGPDNRVTVKDSQSTNGSLVNGKHIDKHVLKDGDLVQIGPEVTMKFTLMPASELELQIHLYNQSIIDELTGLYNRRHLINTLIQAIASAYRHRRPLGLLLVDLDHFKQVNDKHGHATGDSVLVQCAGLLKNALREEDDCARIGGEEFALILRDMDHDKCMDAAERIRNLIAEHSFEIEGVKLNCTTSIGGAMAPQDRKQTPEEMLQVADANLYKAKHRGRNCSVIE